MAAPALLDGIRYYLVQCCVVEVENVPSVAEMVPGYSDEGLPF